MCFWRRSSSVSHFRVFIEKSLSFECITILAALLCSLSRPSLSCLLHPAHTVSQYSNTGRICAWYMELAAWLVRCLRSRPSMPTFFPALDAAYLVWAFHDSVSSASFSWFSAIRKYMAVKNKIRKFWASNCRKIKNIEPELNFPGSQQKKCSVLTLIAFSRTVVWHRYRYSIYYSLVAVAAQSAHPGIELFSISSNVSSICTFHIIFYKVLSNTKFNIPLSFPTLQDEALYFIPYQTIFNVYDPLTITCSALFCSGCARKDTRSKEMYLNHFAPIIVKPRGDALRQPPRKSGIWPIFSNICGEANWSY